MIDLQKYCGLPIMFDSFKLVFGQGVKKAEPSARTAQEMRKVLLDPEAEIASNETYYMYRDVCLEEHQKLLEQKSLRYDIIVIPPLMLGKEFNKTLGHFHAPANNTSFSFTEVYEVFQGKGHFVIQSEKEFFITEAVAGQKVLVPPNFGHITINPSKEPLVMSNWMARKSASDYSPFILHRGAMYYETLGGWVANKNYPEIPKPKKLKPKDFPEFGLFEGKPMYFTGIKEPQKLDFLLNPQKYEKEFKKFLK